MRKRRFPLTGRYDGSIGATVTIEALPAGEWLFSVRPSRRRKSFTALLSSVARGVVYDVSKAEGLATLAARKAVRRG